MYEYYTDMYIMTLCMTEITKLFLVIIAKRLYTDIVTLK